MLLCALLFAQCACFGCLEQSEFAYITTVWVFKMLVHDGDGDQMVKSTNTGRWSLCIIPSSLIPAPTLNAVDLLHS